eukprot:TRINITY_DN6846_c0_g1_i5.p1 TRINITY_DN6846_c0_g1~~TRINITY_DN6846_c0_g1_i5.p1  ORF type:complete len:325 (-),score=62.31 TRINITY_DN6846_c0_g1_i5:388-1269(-)
MGSSTSVPEKEETVQLSMPIPASWINPGSKLAGGQEVAVKALADICELEPEGFTNVVSPPDLSRDQWDFDAFVPYAQRALEIYPDLQKRIDKMVPKRMPEDEFWRLFYCHAYIATGAAALRPEKFKRPVVVQSEPEVEPPAQPKVEIFKSTMKLHRQGTTELEESKVLPSALPCPAHWINAGVRLAGGYNAAANVFTSICNLDAEAFKEVEAPADDLTRASWKYSSYEEHAAEALRMYPMLQNLLDELVPGAMSKDEFWRLFYCHAYIATGAAALRPSDFKTLPPVPKTQSLV